MTTFSILTLFVALRLFLFVSAAPTPGTAVSDAAEASSYWLSSITRQGTVPFGASGYQVFRNVQDFGAKGDGMSPFLLLYISC
jgi:glucan 1,3-beta-glucosidase